MQSTTITSISPDRQERIDTLATTPATKSKRIAKHIAILKNRGQLNIKVIN